MHYFPDVALLITHYKRSKSLESLLSSFEKLDCKFAEVIVSDDGSPAEHLNYVKDVLSNKFQFKLITVPKNKGLGNNINKGQDAVTAPYTLYVQEDFEPQAAFPEVLNVALKMIKEDSTLDIIKFYAYYPYPYTKPYGNGFSETIFKNKIWYYNHIKFYFYSDHPHLRHSDFFKKFGRYPEGEKVDRTEFLMSLSFIRNKARGLIYDSFNDLFLQKNSQSEPSTTPRVNWHQSKKPFILFLRFIYLKFKLIRSYWELNNLK